MANMDCNIQKVDILIIGSGMSALTIADNLSDDLNYLIVEKGDENNNPIDINYVKDNFNVEYPFSIGLGGTTRLWHKGYTKLTKNDYKKWNVDISFLKRLIRKKNEILKFKKLKNIKINYKEKKSKLIINKNDQFIIDKKKIWLNCDILHLDSDCCVLKIKNKEIKLEFKKCIIAAGGLGSPLIVEENFNLKPKPFTDHIMTDIGIIKKNSAKVNNIGESKFEKIIHFSTCKHTGLSTAFYLRDSYTKTIDKNVIFSKSKLIDYYNKKQFIKLLFLLFSNVNLLVEIINIKFGIKLPTKYCKVVIVSEQFPQDNFVFNNKNGGIIVNWSIKEDEINAIYNNFEEIKKKNRWFQLDILDRDEVRPNHFSSSHFSSSLPLGDVIETDFSLKGFKNIYVCDGSIIPTSGFANTGLTIQALACLLAEDMNEHFFGQK